MFLYFILGALCAALPLIMIIRIIDEDMEKAFKEADDAIVALQRARLDDTLKFDKQIAWFKRNSIRESQTIKNYKKMNRELLAENAELKRKAVLRLRKK